MKLLESISYVNFRSEVLNQRSFPNGKFLFQDERIETTVRIVGI